MPVPSTASGRQTLGVPTLPTPQPPRRSPGLLGPAFSPTGGDSGGLAVSGMDSRVMALFDRLTKAAESLAKSLNDPRRSGLVAAASAVGGMATRLTGGQSPAAPPVAPRTDPAAYLRAAQMAAALVRR